MRRYYSVFILLVASWCFLLSGCQMHYTDPYSGQYDPTRSLRSEGFVSTLYHTMAKRGPAKTPGGDSALVQLRCERAGRAKRSVLSRLANDFEQFGHPAVRIEQRQDFFFIHFLGAGFAQGETHLSPASYSVLDQIGEKLGGHRKLYVQVLPPPQDVADEREISQIGALPFQRAQHIGGYLKRHLQNSPIRISTAQNLGVVGLTGSDAYTLAVCPIG